MAPIQPCRWRRLRVAPRVTPARSGWRWRFGILCGVGMATGVLGACEEGGAPADREHVARKKTTPIAFVGRAGDDALSPVLEAAIHYFKSSRESVTVDLLVPPALTAVGQLKILAEIDPQRYRAICVWPIDPSPLRGEVLRLSNAGVSVIIVEHDIADSGRAGFCGVAEERIGEALAWACGRLIGSTETTLGMLHGPRDDLHTLLRLRAFENHIVFYPTGRVVRDVEYDDSQGEAARRLTEEVEKYPRMGGWVLLDDEPLRRLSVDRRAVPRSMSLIVFSRSIQQIDRLRRGTADAIVTLPYRTILDRALALTAERFSPIRTGPEEVWLEPLVVLREDLEEFDLLWHDWTTPAVMTDVERLTPPP
jgi:ABC-type sugar transport system substrate-binding protein